MFNSFFKHVRFSMMVALLALPFPATACDNEAFRLLKELAGQWQVFQQEKLAGELEIRLAAGECALLEEWRSTDGSRASGLHWSETAVDEDGAPVTRLHQVYVDSSGWFIRADGTVTGDVIVYEGETESDDVEMVLRATLHGLGSDEIVHIGDISTDGGATWRRSFTLRYQRIPARE